MAEVGVKKMKKESYIFPVIFTFDDDGITIEFPDLPGCISYADTLDEAVKKQKRNIRAVSLEHGKR